MRKISGGLKAISLLEKANAATIMENRLYQKKNALSSYHIIMELDFKSCCPHAHQVSIESVSKWNKGFLVLLSVWETKEYRSVWQMLAQVTGLEIIKKYPLDKEIRWRCVHGLEEGKYLLGSYHRESKPAVLSLFQEGKLLKTRYFEKGYATGIRSIERTIDDNILLEGEYYTIEPAGGHDEYYPHGWTHKITKDLEDSAGSTATQNQVCFESALQNKGKSSVNYFAYDRYMIGKYNNMGELLWEQDTAITGQERSSKLLSLAPYCLSKENAPLTDGIWAGGKREYASHEKGTGLSFPTLFRLTSGATLLNFSIYLEAIPHLQSVLSIMPGPDRNCYVLGETLIVGEGNGLFLLHIELTPFVVIKAVRYLNLHGNGLPPTMEEQPSFCGEYHSVSAVYKNEEERKFTVFVNTREVYQSNGKVWSLLVD